MLGAKNKFDSYSLYEKQTVMPPKLFLLPKIDDLEADPKNNKLAFFGVHLCDVAAISQLDDVFTNDPHYQSAKNDLLIVATDCQPTSSCFCRLFGADKHFGYDLFIQKESADNFLVFARTERGIDYLSKIKAPIILSATPRPVGYLDQRKINEDDLSKIINQKEDHLDYFQGVANNCFGCGACTAVCPLCFCFDVIDEANPNTGRCHRRRVDDSCFFNNFSKISNYDFRPENVDRLYNWYHHKFVRHFKSHGKFLCTGCGRCIIACPAKLNIIKILSEISPDFKEAINEK